MLFFIIAIVSFVLFSIWKDGQQKRDEVFTTAAKRLDLNLSIEGLVFRKHWLSGFKGKFRIDAGPYGNVQGGKQRPHMGYRITFRDPITLAETSTTHDTSATDAYGSLGAISSISPLNVVIGPEGAGGGDGD